MTKSRKRRFLAPVALKPSGKGQDPEKGISTFKMGKTLSSYDAATSAYHYSATFAQRFSSAAVTPSDKEGQKRG